MATVWVDDDKIKSDYNIRKKTWNCVCVMKPNDKTSDTNDDVKTKTSTKHMKRDTWQVNVHVVFLLVRVVVILTHCTPHRVAQVRVFALISSMHEVSVTLRLWSLHSIQLPTLPILLQSPAALAALQLPRGYVVTLCTPPTRRWGLRTNPTPTQSKQALSRRLQAWHLQKKLVRRLDSLVRVSWRVERGQTRNACAWPGHRRRCSEWPPLARTHAKHLRMNPLVHDFSAASGSRTDSVRTIMARNSSWDWNWRSPSAVSHSCHRWKSSGLRSGEHGGHVRSWISRSFKNSLVRRLVRDGALSSCHHQLDVSVPRRATQCGKYTSSSIRM